MQVLIYLEKHFHEEKQHGTKLIQSVLQHERHECGTSNANETRVQHERNMCNRRETRAEQRECKTSATRVLPEQHECDTSEKF